MKTCGKGFKLFKYVKYEISNFSINVQYKNLYKVSVEKNSVIQI